MSPVPHTESTRQLHEQLGSGWYEFAAIVGFNGIAHVSSTGVNVYNPNSIGYGVNDFSDFLRAVEVGWIAKLDRGTSYERKERER